MIFKNIFNESCFQFAFLYFFIIFNLVWLLLLDLFKKNLFFVFYFLLCFSLCFISCFFSLFFHFLIFFKNLFVFITVLFGFVFCFVQLILLDFYYCNSPSERLWVRRYVLRKGMGEGTDGGRGMGLWSYICDRFIHPVFFFLFSQRPFIVACN